jgi:aryl-alcohol dehydrogenase-like predicted oxidoreductase
MKRRIDSLSVSAVGIGTTSFAKFCDERASTEVVHAALDLGITLFDTADSYGAGRRGLAEEILGKALRGRRADVVIATKVGTEFAGQPATASAEWIRRAVVGSLRRLGTDYLDVYLLHVPDPRAPVGESLAALARLRDAGTVRVIGCSNLSAAQLVEAGLGRTGSFRCVQDGYSVVDRDAERGVLPVCRQTATPFVAYAPLAYGLLTGKYAAGVPAGSRLAQLGPERASGIRTATAVQRAGRFCRYSRYLGVPPEQLALAWLLSSDAVSAVIPGATSADQVRRNAGAVDLLPLPADVVRAIDTLV